MRLLVPAALALAALLAGPAAAELPDLGGRTVVVVTENAYPPLQFVDPETGEAIGWEYDAMAEIAKRLNFTLEIANSSWDAMIPAVSQGQYDIGMTGITIRPDRAEQVDFSDPYMRSEMFMLVRADEDRFTDAASFAAFEEGLVAAQPGTTPFYVAVYDILDGNESNPRVKAVETFGAGVQALLSGDVDLALSDGVAAQGYVEANAGRLKIIGEPMGGGGLRLHLPQGLRPRRAGQRRDRRARGRRHLRRVEHEVVPRLPDRAVAPDPRGPAPPPGRGREFPWWLLAAGLIGGWLLVAFLTDEIYGQILATVSRGLGITALVTVIAFALASGLGLLLAVCVLSRSVVLRQAARFYIEIMRGVPILVLLLYIAFVGAPALVAGWNALARPLGLGELATRDLSLMWRAILALALGYAAFIAEVFRAGIQSVDPGQVEAAKALGLTGWQRFRLVVFPQAIRTILPPLGNDFVALVKDSSLVSVLGVADITQLGKVYAAGSFRFFETYNVVAFLYLVMTIGLSLALRALERRLRARRAG